MILAEHLRELIDGMEEIRLDGHMEDFEIIRRINAAEYEIQQALNYCEI